MNNFAYRFTNRVSMLHKHTVTSLPPKPTRTYSAKQQILEETPATYSFPPWTGWELYSVAIPVSEQHFPPWTGWELYSVAIPVSEQHFPPWTGWELF